MLGSRIEMRAWASLVLLVGLPACRAEPAIVPVLGPDGAPAFHVSCGADEARCYQLSGTRCPFGYELSKTPGESGNFLVRCRYAQAAWVAAPAAPPPLPPTETETPTLAPSPYAPSEPASTATFPPLGPGQPRVLKPDSDIGY